MTLAVKAPDACSSDEIKDFLELVGQGEEVEPGGLAGRVRKAAALVFLHVDNQLAGVAALKNPNDGYRSSVFRKAATETPANEFPFEVGWVFILQRYRGKRLSRKLVEAALSRSEARPVFATSRADNKAMHRTLSACGFSREGTAYASDMSNQLLELFTLRQHPTD
ncbi:MAG: GNAT family N-acetyltransferase [Deltaproteobacteria bacterium]|nr:GNAT family N-acetyltransferase [Deltaproteobacteria bacterium]